ncbi:MULTISPECIES: hypothetical protein [unclassified Methylobacterium]|uniref:hypothetical protein n=1 Tax=unclassified Methylobacterium TaxID=2615210 RepID=UPI001FBACD8D|nr:MULTISPECIES: hypothetical protein [unclassified Methylobacterium]MCJ2015573.1 hypothetical protein [Methylobacterium sp. J-076]MCJ2089790.1 hypothetical protein [Methylobacterium sp. E-005]
MPVSEPARSLARVIAAAKTRAWREARKAEADADAAIVRGLVKALDGHLSPEGRMKCRNGAVTVHQVVVEAMAGLSIASGLDAAVARDRVIARLTVAATPRN